VALHEIVENVAIHDRKPLGEEQEEELEELLS
jgi:hypothetical protein